MKIRLLILFNKLITLGCKLLGKNGTVFPGSILFRQDKTALNKIIYPKYVIGVTGSSGKGSTTALIAKIITHAGLKVSYNKTGSNAVRGIYTTVMNSASFFTTKINADVLLLEIDERHIDLAFPKSVFTHLIITNVTRDQPSRNYHVDNIYDKVISSIGPAAQLIINADDVIVNQIQLLAQRSFVTYGIAKTKYSHEFNNSLYLDHAYCPKCQNKLNYTYYHYGHLGSYECPNGCYKRGNIDYEVTDLDLDNYSLKINGKVTKLDNNVFFAAYYTVAALAVCKEIGISEDIIFDYLNNHQEVSKRMKETLNYKNREFKIIESKNENNLSYQQSLNYLVNVKQKKSIIVGFENVSRRYITNDLSWLWDIDFEILKDDQYLDKIFCVGKFKYDVANRLEYASIPMDKIIIVNDVKNILQEIDKSEGEIFTIVCFEMIEILTKIIKEANHD